MKKYFLFFLAVFFLLILNSTSLQAQVYSANFKDHQAGLISSFLFWSGVTAYDHFRSPEILDEFEDIDPSRLWGIDRKAILQHSPKSAKWSNRTLYASVAIPIAFTMLDKPMRSEAGSIFWMGLQGFFLESGVTDLVKIATERPRPYLYREGEAILNQPLDKNGTKSFFSGHTSTTAYFTFFTAKVFSDLHPDSKLKPFVWGMAAALTGATGYFRYKAGRHFVTDIVVGGLFGASVGIIIPRLYQNKNLSLAAGPGGMSLAFQF